MSINEGQDFLDFLYRKRYCKDQELAFFDLIREWLQISLKYDEVEIDRLATTKENGLWAKLLKEIESDKKRNIIPIFTILEQKERILQWIGLEKCDELSKKRWNYEIRPDLYTLIDAMDSRKYEALACVLCKLMGAECIYLTAPGNEGGIDFIAQIRFPPKAHFLFGAKGPIRIIGQCKFYSTKDTVGHMKEFVQTINDVHNWTFRAGGILPAWFKNGAGPIIGWHIANCGHQSGAVDYAKHYGVLISDTKELIETICTMKCPGAQGLNAQKLNFISTEIEKFLTYPIYCKGLFSAEIL